MHEFETAPAPAIVPRFVIVPPVRAAPKPTSWMPPEFVNGCVMLVVPCGTVRMPPEFWNGAVIVPGPETIPELLFKVPVPTIIPELRLMLCVFVSVLPLRMNS